MSRAFWLSSAVIFLDETLFVAIYPLLPDFASELDLTRAEVGLLLAAYPLFMLVSSLAAGVLVDRFGGRWPIAAGCALLVAATFAFAYADTGWQLWAARGTQGLASGLTSVAGMAVIAGGAVASRRATVIGLATALQGTSVFFGPVLGGFAAPAFGIEIAFLIPAMFGILVFVALLAPGWAEPKAAGDSSFGRALLAALRSPVARGAAACIFAVGFTASAAQTLAPLRLGEFGYSAEDIGGIFLIGAVIAPALTPIAGRLADHRGARRISVIWTTLLALLLLAPALSAARWVTVFLLVALVPLVRVGGTLGYALGAEHAPLGAGLAAGYGVALAAWSLGAVLGPITAGAIADVFGDAAAFAVAAAAAGLLVIPIAAARRGPAERYAVA